MSESSFRVVVLSSLAYPFFENDIEQDAMRKPLLIKKGTDWSNCHGGRPLDTGAFVREERLIRQT